MIKHVWKLAGYLLSSFVAFLSTSTSSISSSRTCQYPAMLTFRLVITHASNSYKYSRLRTSISSRKNIYSAPSEARYTTVSFDKHVRILHGTKKCACSVFTHELLTHQKTRTSEIMNQCVNNVQSTFQVVSCLSYI